MSYGNNVTSLHSRLGVRLCQPKRPTGKYQHRQVISNANDQQLDKATGSTGEILTLRYEEVPS